MGANEAFEIDAWLREGGIVVTASDRAARAIAAAYHRRRVAEGRTAWATPRIMDWLTFARAEWDQRSPDGRLVLTPFQERAIWSDLAAARGIAAATLPQSRHRLAAMAMDAHTLLCAYAPQLLHYHARRGWANDAASFSEWLAAVDETTSAANVLSTSRVALELIPFLKRESLLRAPLLLAGFDRLLPLQRALFDAWGDWKLSDVGKERGTARFYIARDSEAELAACAKWCDKMLTMEPASRILVLTQDTSTRRGEIERAFLNDLHGASARFEFSLGVPLGEVAIARAAVSLLRWLSDGLEEHQLDWLIASGHSALDARETASLQARMRDLRRRGLQRTRWAPETFLKQRGKVPAPPAWERRMSAAQHRLDSVSTRERSPVGWVELASLLLKEMGWPGETLGSSVEFQATQRLQQVIEMCGSLGFDGRNMQWNEFLRDLERAVADTLFTPQSQDAPVLIAGPAESAGLTADGIWLLGASEEAWPAKGSLNALLPLAVQREARMPHASPQLDWELAQTITARLLASAREVCSSCSRHTDGVEVQPSRLIARMAGSPTELPVEFASSKALQDISSRVEDRCDIPLFNGALDSADGNLGEPIKIRGGSETLTSQSQCAFKAFATARLGARTWDTAAAGLSPSQRGQLLHAALHAIWGGPPNGLRNLDDLLSVADPRVFVSNHVQQVMRNKLPDAARELMPQRYLELEAQRLTRLLSKWLEYEAARLPFTVVSTELNTTTTVKRLSLDLRLDRIDQLNDGSLLVIDYKTGNVSPKSWDVPRPDDLQLPLYASFGLQRSQELGGLLFAKIRVGDLCFSGTVGDAANALGQRLTNAGSLKKDPLTAEKLMDWRAAIEQLAEDFLAGRADVDPLDPPETCDRCGLQTLCRIHERNTVDQDDDAGEADE